MALLCIKGGECNGCTDCRKEREEIEKCIICQRSIFKGEEALLTEGGLVCKDGDCLFEFCASLAEKEDFLSFVKEDEGAFVEFILEKRGYMLLPSF